MYIFLNFYFYFLKFWLLFLLLFTKGQSDMFENGSSGDTSEDLMFDNIPNPRRPENSIQQGKPSTVQDKDYRGLWSNSSR
jgi:hypothetical protein